MKTELIRLRFSILLLIVFCSNCTKEIPEDQVLKIIEIASVNPTEGRAETEVTILGINLGTDITKVSVFFNETEAEISMLTDTSIKTNVPRGATTGNIKVIVEGEEIQGPEFNYLITPAQVTTFAGQETDGDIIGPLTEASFNLPIGILKDSQGMIYVADVSNHKIKKIDPVQKIVTLLAGSTIGNMNGTGANVMFANPRLMAFDSNENIIVSDQSNHQIKKITLDGVVTTITGIGTAGFDNGPSTTATFRTPMGIAVDAFNNIYVSDFNNHSIRKITAAGAVTTIAGTGVAGDLNGVGIAAQLNNPVDLAIAADGNIFVADYKNHKIKKIAPDGTVTTAVGSGIVGDVDGSINEAQFNLPQDVLIATDGTIYIADTANHKIKKVTTDGIVTTIAGTGIAGADDGDALSATFTNPRELLLDDSSGEIYVVTDDTIRIISPEF